MAACFFGYAETASTLSDRLHSIGPKRVCASDGAVVILNRTGRDAT
jgi:hypothetical protein